jgi:hypothetical protein
MADAGRRHPSRCSLGVPGRSSTPAARWTPTWAGCDSGWPTWAPAPTCSSPPGRTPPYGTDGFDVALLSLVDELDVAEHAVGFLDRHGDFFRRLAADWAGLLGPTVTAPPA